MAARRNNRFPLRATLSLEPCESRLMLAFLDLSAAHWSTAGQVIVENHDLDGDTVFDSIKITLGDENLGPQDRVAVPDNGYYMYAAIEVPWGTSVMVDVEEYDLQTYAAVDEVSNFRIGLSDDQHVQLPEDTMWQPIYQGIQPRTSMGQQRIYGLATTEKYLLHVGLDARGISSPTDDGASYGTVIIRNIDVRDDDDPHDPDCESDARSGGAALHNGESSFTISLNAGANLHYNSFDNPHPILTADYVLPDPVPDMIEVTIDYEFNFPGFEQPTVYYDTSHRLPDEHVRVALQPSIEFEGSFQYELLVTPYHDGVPAESERLPGRYGVQDRRFSPFGNRFALLGLDHLVPHFGVSGDLTGVQLSTADSNAVWFTHDGQGGFQAAAGVFSELHQHPDGTYTLTDHLGNTSRFDMVGQLSSRADANGNHTRYEYDASYLLERIIDPFGRVTHFEYADGLLTAVTDFAGRTTTLGYDGDHLVRITDPDPDGAGPLVSPETTLAYDINGRLSTVGDARAHTNFIEYDAFGLVAGGIQWDGTRWSVQPSLQPALIDMASGTGTLSAPAPAVTPSEGTSIGVDARGYATRTVTDHFGLAMSQVDALDHRYAWQRDQHGRLLQQIEPDPDGSLGNLVTTYAYASCSNVSQITYPDQTQVHYQYNAISRPTQFIDEIGRMILFDYDGPDIDGDGTADGPNVTVQTVVMGARDFLLPRHPDDPDDLVTTFAYSDATGDLPRGLMISETDPLGRTTRHRYQTDPARHDFGWLVETIHAEGTADEASVHYEYDVAGNVTVFTNELGHRTEYLFDALDRLIKVTRPDPDPLNGQTDDQPVQHLAYDENDNLVLMTDAEGYRTQYQYDAANRLVEIKQERPDGPGGLQAHLITSYTYDGNGNRLSEIDPAGRVTRYHYDPLDRLIAVIEEDVDQLHTRPLTNPVNAYDVNADGQVDEQDLQLVIAAVGDSQAFAFDPRTTTPAYVDVDGDLAVTVQDHLATVSFIAAADADQDARVDAAEILAAGIVPSQDPTERPISRYRYDAVGNVMAAFDANGNETRYRYDARHRLVETVLPAIEDEHGCWVTDVRVTSTYDDAGQLVAETDALGRVTHFQYDDAGRLTRVELPDAGNGTPTTTYAYDLASNLVAIVDPLGNTTTMTYDARDRLIQIEAPDPDPSNATSADVPVTTYELDDAGRQVKIVAPENRVTEYVYDDLDRVVEVRLPDPGSGTGDDQPVIQMAYDREDHEIARVDAEGNLTVQLYDALYRLRAVVEETPEGTPGGMSQPIDLSQLETLRGTRPVTEYAYDEASNLVLVRDPLSRETRFAYDALHRLQTTALPDPVTGEAARSSDAGRWAIGFTFAAQSL